MEEGARLGRVCACRPPRRIGLCLTAEPGQIPVVLLGEFWDLFYEVPKALQRSVSRSEAPLLEVELLDVQEQMGERLPNDAAHMPHDNLPF
jgi:hypothetical protein